MTTPVEIPTDGCVPVVRSLAEYHLPPPCCRRAQERGYRRGYKDGYTCGFWDAGTKLSGAIWARFWRFRHEVLAPWMRRSWGEPPPPWEGGPRFGPAAQKRRPGPGVVPGPQKECE